MRLAGRHATTVGTGLLVLATTSLWLACSTPDPILTARPQARSTTSAPDEPRHEVEIRAPEGPLTVDSGLSDANGQPIGIRCATCHALRDPSTVTLAFGRTEAFHLGLTVEHGDLPCQACHFEPLYESLALTGNRHIAVSNVMALCAQCHGTQKRDYDHGAHGGMNGYWDLGRGPRWRNNCVDCHDPHAPAFIGGAPAPRARDRFLSTADHSTEDGL